MRLEEEATSADLKARAAEARNADHVTKSRQNQASKTAIGRSIAQIMEIGRQLDSVAFRMKETERKASLKMAQRRKAIHSQIKIHDRHDIVRVSREAALFVLRKYLRQKRRQHFGRLLRFEKEKCERLERLGEISVHDARQILKRDLSMEVLSAEKRKEELRRSQSEFPPVVLAFSTFRHDLSAFLVQEAVQKQAEMNRAARMDALRTF